MIFNEIKLKEEIAKQWGEHGAHMEVYMDLLKRVKKGKKLIIIILPIGGMTTLKAKEIIAQTYDLFKEESIESQFDVVILPDRSFERGVRIEAFVSDDDISTLDLDGLEELVDRLKGIKPSEKSTISDDIWDRVWGFDSSKDAELLANSLDAYIKEKHTQEECIGYIDGFKQAVRSKNCETRWIYGSIVGILAGISIGWILFS